MRANGQQRCGRNNGQAGEDDLMFIPLRLPAAGDNGFSVSCSQAADGLPEVEIRCTCILRANGPAAKAAGTQIGVEVDSPPAKCQGFVGTCRHAEPAFIGVQSSSQAALFDNDRDVCRVPFQHAGKQ